MKKHKKKNAAARSEQAAGHLPLRGGVLSRLLAAFRLRQGVINGYPDVVAEGTAKHGMNDHRDIGINNHLALLRIAVDGLFTGDYLSARGLNASEAKVHNDIVTRAVDSMLARWDRHATSANLVPERAQWIGSLLDMATGFSSELLLRLAAYDVLYGYLHPFLSEDTSWLAGPRLCGWWNDINRRAQQSIKVSQLYDAGQLDSHTVRDIQGGKALPNEGTVAVLASRLAAYSIRNRGDATFASAAELEFELRVATAAVEYRHVAEPVLVGRKDDSHAIEFLLLRGIFEGLTDSENEDLVRHGTTAAAWGRVEGTFKLLLQGQITRMFGVLKEQSDYRLAASKKNPNEARRAFSDELASRAAEIRNRDPRPGADGPEQRLAEFIELQHHVPLLLATNGRHRLPMPREELMAEMSADGLCAKAIAPWLEHTDEEKERLFREAIQSCSWSAHAHRCLAQHLRALERTEEAIQLYHRAVILKPENEEGREALVVLLSARGEHAEVLALTEQYQSSTFLRSARAYSLLKLGNARDAEVLVREVLAVQPRQTTALRVLAGCLRASGDERGARENERRAEFLERGVARSKDY